MSKSPIQAVLVGAGSRGRDTAGGFALRHPDKLKFVAVAEPDDERRTTFARLHSLPDQNCFSSYEALFDRPPLAPVCFNLTMDRTHLESSVMALEKGYHLFLEKPMAHTAEACFAIREAARKHKRMVQICHPLRYTPFYNKVRELIDSGIIGDLTSVSMSENVGYWHYAHSYVRGNWRRKDTSGPLILTKTCHDMDLISWFVGSPARRVSSFGTQSLFTRKNKPEGAPKRCTDGCPAENTCPFFAPAFYLPLPNEWPANVICLDPSPEARMNALRTGPYGRCVFQSDNNVPDHQVVAAEFENGVTLDFIVRGNTLGCFRTIRLSGTKGELNGHFEKNEISVRQFGQKMGLDELILVFTPASFFGGHGGGDTGVISHFLEQLAKNDRAALKHSLDIATEGHLLAFAAEEARVAQSVIEMKDFRRKLGR